MDIRIKTSDYDMPEAISIYLDERIAALEKFLGADADTARVEIELGRATGKHKHSEYQWFAEVQIKRPGQKAVVARNSEPSINAAIDKARDEVRTQLLKLKTVHASKDRKEALKAKRMLNGEV